jgi:hypothetical protein
MITQFIQRFLFLVVLILSLVSASAVQPQLTGISVFSANATGNWVGSDVWDTQTNANYEIGIKSGTPSGSFLNAPGGSLVQPSISLASGVDTFSLLADPGIDLSYFGINLFFNNSSTPSISAFGPETTSAGPHSFVADGASLTPAQIPGPQGQNPLPGAGTLSFTFGNETITLTDFFWATPSLNNLDQVGQYSTGADGSTDFVGGITFSVTAVPEPRLSLWVFGLLVVTAIHRKTRRALQR